MPTQERPQASFHIIPKNLEIHRFSLGCSNHILKYRMDLLLQFPPQRFSEEGERFVKDNYRTKRMVSKPLHRRKNSPFRILQSPSKYTLNSYSASQRCLQESHLQESPGALSSAAFQEPHSATPQNKSALTPLCPGISLQLSLQGVTGCIISININNGVSLTLHDFHLTTGEGSGHQDWKCIFPLSLSV